jgi:hypothetical protein
MGGDRLGRQLPRAYYKKAGRNDTFVVLPIFSVAYLRAPRGPAETPSAVCSAACATERISLRSR